VAVVCICCGAVSQFHYLCLTWLSQASSAATLMTEVLMGESNIVASAAVGLEGPGNQKETRWLAYVSMRELYDSFRTHVGSNGDLRVASYATFVRVYRQEWKQALKIRRLTQHARCKDCARFSRMLEKAMGQEKLDIERARQSHLASMFADRRLETRLNSLSEASTKEGCVQSARVLKLDIDGMDQAKFRLPRNVGHNSKSLADVWRPAQHVVGIIVWGVMESYVIMDADIPKDASSQITAICEALDKTDAILKGRGLTLPAHLVCQADNTTRETKNASLMLFGAMLVAAGRFKSVSFHFHRCGHTHGPLDQRFSLLATALARGRTLQTPEDFLACIRQRVFPARNRVRNSYVW
jgi:hypothetical protein